MARVGFIGVGTMGTPMAANLVRKGFAVTLRRMTKKPSTFEYPDEKREFAPRFRGLPSLRADPETGEALCVACGLCARICPTSCLEMHVVPSEEGDRELGEFILSGSAGDIASNQRVAASYLGFQHESASGT